MLNAPTNVRFWGQSRRCVVAFGLGRYAMSRKAAYTAARWPAGPEPMTMRS
jgi:hypothetical protein